MNDLQINGVKIEIKDICTKQGELVSQRVTILDKLNDVCPYEAEQIVKYLYMEGFIKSQEVYLQVEK